MSISTTLSFHKASRIESIAPISVTNTLGSMTISPGQGIISLRNWGTKVVWVGGPETDADTEYGWPLIQGDAYEVPDAREEITVYYHCASGDTSTLVGMIR